MPMTPLRFLFPRFAHRTVLHFRHVECQGWPNHECCEIHNYSVGDDFNRRGHERRGTRWTGLEGRRCHHLIVRDEAVFESQRDSVSQPSVATKELRWEIRQTYSS